MHIALLGATSQIAQDLVLNFAQHSQYDLHLFARRPADVRAWLARNGWLERYVVDDFAAFPQQDFDAVVNFVGVGNPAQAVALGNTIFDLTQRFDQMVLDYLQTHSHCRYLFLSSGAVYGSTFEQAVDANTPAIVPINALPPQAWYGVAKLYAECRHRALPDTPIIDIRVFNYFSHSQDMSARFLMTDIVRAIRDNSVLHTSSDYIVRDFLHPTDFYRLIMALLNAPASNAAVDCYSLAPVDKPSLLAAMQEKFGLRYAMTASAGVNATGNKPHYYSLNRRAAAFGYQPSYTSLECVLHQVAELFRVVGCAREVC